MRLTYWKAKCLDDHDCYSIRTKTRKEAKEIREQLGPEMFTEPYKVEVEYNSGFDLLLECLSECGVSEDYNEPAQPGGE